MMNTPFEKVNVFKYIWQHPGTKHWHCIDYIIMWQNDQSLCQDVNVRCCAECWTDYKLLCAKLSLKVQWRRVRKFKRRRYAVVFLQDSNISKELKAEVKKLLSEGWMIEEGAASKWFELRNCILKAAKSDLGWEDSKQPN